jgi:hypothetical protein
MNSPGYHTGIITATTTTPVQSSSELAAWSRLRGRRHTAVIYELNIADVKALGAYWYVDLYILHVPLRRGWEGPGQWLTKVDEK